MQAWTKIAQLISTKNLQGGLVAQSVAGPFVSFYEGLEVALVPPVLDAPRSCTVSVCQELGDGRAFVQFSEIDDVETAQSVVGCYCLCKRDGLSQEERRSFDVPNWDGYQVTDRKRGFLGTVKRIDELPMQRLLVVERAEGESGAQAASSDLLIPLVDEFVKEVDEEGSHIYVDLIDGLLEL